MFLLKKIISPFFMPVSAFLALALLGLIFLWFTRRQKTGKVLLTISTVFLGLLSYGAVSDMLARPLEEKYPPISDFQSLKGVKWIVVLAGGSTVDRTLPLSTYLAEASLVRLSEGIRIHNKLTQTRLVFTGGSGFKGFTPEAEVLADTAMALFKKHGMHPIPAPTDYLVMQKEGISPGDFFPNAGSLGKAGQALHEYLGIVWAKLRDQI